MHVHARVRKLMVGVVLLDRALARNLEPQLLKAWVYSNSGSAKFCISKISRYTNTKIVNKQHCEDPPKAITAN